MAFTVDMPTEFMAELSDKETKELFESVLNASKDVLVHETSRAIEATGKGKDIYKKVKATKPKRTKNGSYNIAAYPQGTTSEGTRAGDVAFYIEYGTTNGKGKANGNGVHISARPWRVSAEKNANDKALPLMEKAYDEWLNKKVSEGWTSKW